MARNLLFVGICLAGLVALAASLAPRPRLKEWQKTPDRVELPEFETAVQHIDRLFRNVWQQNGLQPSPRADDLTIARRLSRALTGTVPSLEEIRMFEAHPPEHRLQWWTEGLLRDRRSSDYLAERLARAFVGVQDGQFLIYRRRRFVTWLADELHENRPYDQLVRTLIASDGLWTDKPATNFVTAAIKPDSDQGVQENVMASRVSRAFLGVRLDCAECHDHPFNEWKQKDFHGLAAFFGPAEQSLMGIRDGKSEYMVDLKHTGQETLVAAAVPFHGELLPRQGASRQRLAAWVTDPKNEVFARAIVNRVWSLLFGRALLEPVDNIPLDTQAAAVDPDDFVLASEAASGPGRNTLRHEVLKVLADDFVTHHYDLRRLIQVIASSQVFQLDSQADPAVPGHELTEMHEKAWATYPITRLRPEQVVGGVLQACSLETIDYQSHIIVRIMRAIGQNDFVQRYGDAGEDELAAHGGTIPQRLLMMNGELVHNQTKESVVGNAASQIAALAPSDAKAVETAYLAVMTRRPSPREAERFEARLKDSRGGERSRRLEDLYWVLINASEFSWNH